MPARVDDQGSCGGKLSSVITGMRTQTQVCGWGILEEFAVLVSPTIEARPPLPGEYV